MGMETSFADLVRSVVNRGGVVFTGDAEGNALDAASGKSAVAFRVLCVYSSPMTYADGKQHVAVAAEVALRFLLCRLRRSRMWRLH